jgi:hypothetical protein
MEQEDEKHDVHVTYRKYTMALVVTSRPILNGSEPVESPNCLVIRGMRRTSLRSRRVALIDHFMKKEFDPGHPLDDSSIEDMFCRLVNLGSPESLVEQRMLYWFEKWTILRNMA